MTTRQQALKAITDDVREGCAPSLDSWRLSRLAHLDYRSLRGACERGARMSEYEPDFATLEELSTSYDRLDES